MKNRIIIGIAALLLTVSANAGLWETLNTFLANNPNNSWDVSAYGLNNLASSQADISKGWGGGARIGYWLNPSIGAALDTSYCEEEWTFASLSLTARVTVTLGTLGSVSPYVMAGPGYTFSKTDTGGVDQEVVAVAGGGMTLHLDKLKWFDLFGEYVHITTSPEAQDQVRLGIVRRF